jgi:hypothetical protein
VRTVSTSRLRKALSRCQEEGAYPPREQLQPLAALPPPAKDGKTDDDEPM